MSNCLNMARARIYVTGNVWNQAFYRMPRQSIECPASQAFYRMSSQSIECQAGQGFYRIPRYSIEYLTVQAFYRMPGCFHNFHISYELGLRPRELS